MKLKNRLIIRRLIQESLVEQEEKPAKPSKKTKKTGVNLKKYQENALDQATTNRLALGRPKAIGKELKEKSQDPAGAAEIMETLGVSGATGANVYEAVADLMNAAAKHEDMGQVIGDAMVVVNDNENPTKAGTAITLAGGIPAKESFYYVRELWRAAKTLGYIAGGEGTPRLEGTQDGEFLVFYHGPSRPWFKEQNKS